MRLNNITHEKHQTKKYKNNKKHSRFKLEMQTLKNMNESSSRGIFLSIALLLSITLFAIPSSVYGENITVESVALEETTILELTNETDENVNILRIWPGENSNFKSFKTEKGWIGEKTPQGVIIFTSSNSINPGESAKFGVKTDKSNPGINWKAINEKNVQIETGKSIAGKLPAVAENAELNQELENTGEGISSKSSFKIIPEKPNVGSTIRVTGDNFGASQEFDFYISAEKIGTFETDERGHFMTTMKIPSDQKADRTNFKVVDKEGEEKMMSLRIGNIENRIPDSQNIPLTIKGIPDIIHRGQSLEIFGTGDPGSAITTEITTSEGEVINSRTAEIDSKGNWELEEPIIVPVDTPFGEYSATITDGRESKLVYWTVETDKKIIISPTYLKFEPGEVIEFTGTALPNKSIELILEDPLGKEIFSDIIKIGGSGAVEFDFPTSQNTPEGTYTLIATQDNDKEFSYVGLGQRPSIPVNLEFDKLSYKTGDTAVITLAGKASEIISLLIIDPSDKPIGETISITLQPDGRATHSISLDGFSSGIYNAVISKGSSQSSEVFTVGLQTGSGEIKINTTKQDYHSGDSILILGDTSPNVLLTITMINSEGDEIKTKETFSDKNGKISESTFRIPSDIKAGIWTITAKSGSNFDNIEIEVHAINQDGMVVQAEEGQDIPGYGKTINIHVIGAKQTVTIEIMTDNGEIIEELVFPASTEGEINQPWIIPKDTEPGTYTIRATDAFNIAETEFEIQ